ncbi:MAG: protein kinase domain-containing protein [Microcoleaceae cyanobacterium]
MATPISSGIVLRNQYYILRQLGQGGFGRTYLAKDRHRFEELCVVKEFAPQLQNPSVWQKAQELFEREAQTLYRLKHPQIPQFRELFRESLDSQVYLFVVQDYVAGSTYRELLSQPHRHGTYFGEAEVIRLLEQLLPVLIYIHSHGVVHRDISPENMIQRQSDGLPILIDFGGVKHLKTKVEELGTSSEGMLATRLGKRGYAPEEQMQLGVIYPHSDLYSLAATALVLLTGKEPHHLIDPQLQWQWRQDISLSPQFGAILDKMLAQRPGDRYQSALEVLRVLESIPHLPAPLLSQRPAQPNQIQPLPNLPYLPQQLPVALAEPNPPQSPLQNSGQNPRHKLAQGLTQGSATVEINTSSPPQVLSKFWGLLQPKTGLLVMISMVVMGLLGWLGAHYITDRLSPSEESQFGSLSETQRQSVLTDRSSSLDVNYEFFTRLVNDIFYLRYPDQQGRILTQSAEDAVWRKRWDQTANELLNRLENLSPTARQALGTYDTADLKDWIRTANQLNLSSHALYDLADAQFFNWFPEQPRNRDLNDSPIGQVWYAVTRDRLEALGQSNGVEHVRFEGESRQGFAEMLMPGGGKAYVIDLNRGQNLRITLQTPIESTFLSIYPPGSAQTEPLLEDSRRLSWSGQLEDSGYYELVIISDRLEPLDYQLTIEVDQY